MNITRKTWIATASGAVLAIALAGGGVYAASGGFDTAPEPVSVVQIAEVSEPAVEPATEPTVAPIVVAPPVTEPAPAPPPPAPAPATPNKCPAGTIAGAVDGAGNESNCQATNSGQPCVEYNDANQCVAWYKP